MSIAQVYALKLPAGRQGHACVANLQSFPGVGLGENLPNPPSWGLTLHSKRLLNLSWGGGLGGSILCCYKFFASEESQVTFSLF